MSNIEIAAITLGAQTSREDDRTSPHVLELRKLIANYCKGPYAKNVKEFALILRIGGDMMEFNFKDCEKIKFNKKNQYITVDLGFPSYEWKGKSDSHIRRYLIDIVRIGLRCCVSRLEKEKIAVESSRMFSEFEKVREQYLV